MGFNLLELDMDKEDYENLAFELIALRGELRRNSALMERLIKLENTPKRDFPFIYKLTVCSCAVALLLLLLFAIV